MYLIRLRGLYGERGSALGEPTLQAYRSLCDSIGRAVRATTIKGDVVSGQAVGVGDDGDLLVATRDGLERVAFGEIHHLEPTE
jgi:BirA family biotin operon repressor/biotin-[acetyl-CoA-carboxylase] ligase